MAKRRESQEPPQSDLQRARSEAASLIGVDVKRMSASDALRVDLALTLRRAIDQQTESAFDGDIIDLRQLMVAIERLTALLPVRALETRRDDPRETLLRIYLDALENGQLVDGKREPKLIEKLQGENAALRAEVERLRGGKVIDPRECDVIPPGEVGEFYCGDVRPGPDCDDPPKRSPVVIEGKAAPAAAAPKGPPAPVSDAEREANRQRINSTPPPSGYLKGQPAPWRQFVGDNSRWEV